MYVCMAIKLMIIVILFPVKFLIGISFAFIHIAPSSAPEWVNGTATTSTTITIQWGAVPCMDQNSEITGYKVRYGPVGSSQRATDAVSVSGSTGGMYTLTGLIPFTNYSTEVAAVNTNGDTGPFSLPHFAETLIRKTEHFFMLKSSTSTFK